MQSKNRKSRRHVVGGFDALETRTLLSVLINTQPTVNVELMPPRVRGWHGRGVAIIQPTDITVSGTAQPPAANVAIEIEVYGLDANGQVLNSGNPLAVTTTNFLGRYQTTFSLPSTMRKDMNSIIVRERAVGFIDGTQVIDPTTLTNLTGNLAINATTISNLEASLSLQPGTLSNLQGNIRINGWDGDLDGTVGPTLASGEFVGTFEGEVDIDVIGVGETAGEVESDGPVELDIEEADVDGTVTNPDLSGGLSDGTADEGAAGFHQRRYRQYRRHDRDLHTDRRGQYRRYNRHCPATDHRVRRLRGRRDLHPPDPGQPAARSHPAHTSPSRPASPSRADGPAAP